MEKQQPSPKLTIGIDKLIYVDEGEVVTVTAHLETVVPKRIKFYSVPCQHFDPAIAWTNSAGVAVSRFILNDYHGKINITAICLDSV